jgi:hypothetical protein
MASVVRLLATIARRSRGRAPPPFASGELLRRRNDLARAIALGNRFAPASNDR